MNGISRKVYRFNFSNEIVELITDFSKLHKYAAQNDYKEAWDKWYREHDEAITVEDARLKKLGYDGMINNKMYKASRYYFRKKSEEKKEPAKRRQYMANDRQLMDAMDLHIQRNTMNEDFTPANGFDDFCKLNAELISIECRKFKSEETEFTVEDINLKIKKTYKNRYFQYKNN